MKLRDLFGAAIAAALMASACGAMEHKQAAGEETPTPTPTPVPTGTLLPSGLAAYCQIPVDGVGTIDVETDYLPHVVQCENGGATLEALKVQAISARSYAYYKLQVDGHVADGVGDQVYTCASGPNSLAIQAVNETKGQILMYHDTVVAAFFVAGANPSNRTSCKASNADNDPTGTETYVTYNEGLSGASLEQTTLGWVNSGNWANRGCMGQWGARCLDQRGDGFDSILRFYYGADIKRSMASGPCTDGTPMPPPAFGTGAASQPGVLWSPSMRLGSH